MIKSRSRHLLDDVTAFWEQVLALRPLSDKNIVLRTATGQDHNFKKHAKYLYDDKAGLGKFLRLKLICYHFDLGHSDIVKIIGKQKKADVDQEPSIEQEPAMEQEPAINQDAVKTQKVVERALGYAGDYWFDTDAENAIARYVLNRIPLTPGQDIDPGDLWTKKFRREDAVGGFCEWLEYGAAYIRDHIGQLPTTEQFPFFDSEDRDSILSESKTFISRGGDHSIFVIHQDSMQTGLTAFAVRLLRQVRSTLDQDARLPCLYISLSRRLFPHRYATLSNVIARLDAFYDNSEEDLEFTPEPSDSIDVAIERIRKKMSHFSSLLVFDGVTTESQSLPYLRILMRDDPLPLVLDRLLRPYHESVDRNSSISSRFGTKILILSDNKIDDIVPSFIRNRQLPYPIPKDTEKLLRQLKLVNTEEILSTSIPELNHENVAYLTDLLITVRKRLLGFSTEAFRDEVGFGTLSELVGILVLTLKAHKPLTLMVLRFLSIVEGSVRHSTMLKLLNRWRLEASDADEARALMFDHVTMFDLQTVLGELDKIVVVGPDEIVAPLDCRPHDFEHLWRSKDTEEYDSIASKIESSEIIDSLIQYELEKDLEATEARTIKQLMHRLVAEEAMEQFIIISRHSDPGAMTDIRTYRRLATGLYHGYASLPAFPDSDNYIELKTPHLIVNNPTGAYRHLYAVFYRSVLERPPQWAMSRIFGSTSVKLDLMRLAVNPGSYDRMSANGRGRTWNVAPGSYLQPADTNFMADSADGELFRDQLAALAKACLRTNRFEQVRRIIEIADRADDHQRRDADATAVGVLRKRLPFIRVEIDYLILQKEFMLAKEICVRTLVTWGFDRKLLAEIRMIPNVSYGAADQGSRGRLLDKELYSFVEKHFKGKDKPAHMDAWADMLARLAEIVATEADMKSKRNEAIPEFIDAFVLFFISNQIRRSIFELEPLGRRFALSGHISRVFIRTCLQLVSIPRQLSRNNEIISRNLPNESYFLDRARRQADILTVYYSQFSYEKASMLIIESMFSRILGDEEGLEAALRLLCWAETLLPSVVDHPRLWMRFLLERAKTFRRLSERLRKTDAERAARYVEFAHADATRLYFMAERDDCKFWLDLAVIQRLRASKLSQKNET